MITFYLIRHGNCEPVGKRIAGRSQGIHLDDHGCEQVEKLSHRLSSVPFKAIYSSPLERTIETAACIAQRQKVGVTIDQQLNEVDYGDWTGKTFPELHAIPLWHQFNAWRATVRIPNGETSLEVQARMAGETERLRREHGEGAVAIVSHGDPLRSLIAYYGGIPIEESLRVTIDPASVSMIAVDDYGSDILCVNYTEDFLTVG